MSIIDVKLNLCALHYLGAEVQFLVVRFNGERYTAKMCPSLFGVDSLLMVVPMVKLLI